jgi:hypothetical protein
LYRANADEKYNIETYIELSDGTVYKEKTSQDISEITKKEELVTYYIAKEGAETCDSMISCFWDLGDYKGANMIESYEYRENQDTVGRFSLNKSDATELLSSAYGISRVEDTEKENTYTFKKGTKENEMYFEGNSIYIKEDGLSYYHQYTFESVDDSYPENIIKKMKKWDGEKKSTYTKEIIEYLGLKF